MTSSRALTLPLGGDAELSCDAGSLMECAQHAIDAEPRVNASANELVALGLETLIARAGGGATVADLAGSGDEVIIRTAADAIGGFACDGGRTLRRSQATAQAVTGAVARARGFGNWTRAGCDGPADNEAGAALIEGDEVQACGVINAVNAAFAHLPERAAVVIRGALPCTTQGFGGAWSDILALRRPTLDMAVAGVDGGLAVVLRRAPRFSPPPMTCDFRAFDADRVAAFGTPAQATAHGRRFVDADAVVAWAVDVARDRAPALTCADAAAFTASLDAASLEGPDDRWDKAALLGCPSRPWLGDALRAHAPGRPFRAVFVGANKGYGLAALLNTLAPSLGVSPATWGVSLRRQGARLACGWCRDCLEVEAEEKEKACAKPPGALRVDLVEPLRANVELLEGCLRLKAASVLSPLAERGSPAQATPVSWKVNTPGPGPTSPCGSSSSPSAVQGARRRSRPSPPARRSASSARTRAMSSSSRAASTGNRASRMSQSRRSTASYTVRWTTSR